MKEKYKMNNEQLDAIIERLDYIEFRQELLFSNSDLDRSIFEYELTKEQYRAIMDVMDEYRNLIENNKNYSHYDFENALYAIVPKHNGDYHMCEELAKGFMDDGRWEEVFMALYGDMPKYSYLKRER